MRDKPQTTAFTRRKLPHWEVVGGCYFVTIRLKGSIPTLGLERLREQRRELERLTGDDEIHQARRAMFREMEYWLENAPAVTHLTKPEIAWIVIDSIENMAERRVWLPISYTLMPNHLHLFIKLGDVASQDEPRPQSLISAIQNFKRWTARVAAKELGIRGSEFWQREWFDHWSRGPESDERIRRYVRMNAVKAGLADKPEDWPYFWELSACSQAAFLK